MLRNLVVHSSPLCINAEPCLKKKKEYIPEIALCKLHLRGILEECALPLKVCVY